MKTSRSNVLLQECVYFINVGLDSTVHTHRCTGRPQSACVCNGTPGTTTKKPQPAGNQVDFDAQLMMIIIVFFISFFFYFQSEIPNFFKRKKS